MRISVLIPTKNRLEYLRYAVESVRRQDFPDWEVIVADNCSSDDVEGFVQTLDDDRVQYIRPDGPLPVTANWNLAMSQSTGDYVVMLGDDDALVQGHLRSVAHLARAFSSPDVIYTGAWLFAYPGADPAWPDGYLMEYGYARFLRNRSAPYILDPASARRLVDDFLAFRCAYGYNGQFMAFSRALIQRLLERGPVYQSPFPDYYAANAAMLASTRILAVPRPLVVIGVTPKSYGHFHHEKRESDGVAFLGQEEDEEEVRQLADVVLPGTNINTSWLFAAERLRSRFADVPHLRSHHRRYRNLQILRSYIDATTDGTGAGDLTALRAGLSHWERIATRVLLDGLAAPTPLLRTERARVLTGLQTLHRQFLRWDPPREVGRYRTIMEAVCDIEGAGDRP